MIAALGLAATLLQGPSPLARAESLLVAGDTAKAIAVLRAVPFDDDSTSENAMAASLALLWLGRSDSRHDETGFVRNRADQLYKDLKANANAAFQGRQHVDDLLTRMAMRGAVAIEVWAFKMAVVDSAAFLRDSLADVALLDRFLPGDSARVLKGVGARKIGAQVDTLRAYGDTLKDARTLVAGAIRNAVAQYYLRALIDVVQADIPTAARLPPQCRATRGYDVIGRAFSAECAFRDALTETDPGLSAVVERNRGASRLLVGARQQLIAGLRDPWPFGAMAFQTLAGIEVLFGTDSSRLALSAHAVDANVDSITASRVTGMALALSGRSDSASAFMDRHRAAFAPFDTLVGPLEGRLRESPAVLWRTAWPLYLQPFNERLVVHRARAVAASLLPILSSSLSHAASFSPPAALIRRGMPRRLERYGRDDGRFISYVSRRTQETVLPAVSGSDRPLDLDLSLAASDQTRGQSVVTGFVPQAYDHLLDLPHQAIRYQRSGHAIVDFFAQAAMPREASCRYEAGFFLLGNDLRLLRRARDTMPAGHAPRLHYTAPVGPGNYVYSIEVLDTACRVAARARYTFAALLPAPGLALSDILLIEGDVAFDPRRVTGGIPVTGRAGLEVAVAEPVSLYWEVYGVRAAEKDTARLLIEVDAVDVRRGRVPVTMLGQVQERAEGAKADATVRYTASVPPGDGPLGIALTVKVPAVPGAVCRVTVVVTDQRTLEKATGTRTFYVRYEPK